MARAFHILTFGCKVNQYETQALREAWLAAGAVETDDPACAAVVCVNTCAVTVQAVSEARKAVRRLHRLAPTARLLLTGCAAAKVGDETNPECAVLMGLPGIHAVYEPDNKPELLHLFDAVDEVHEIGNAEAPFSRQSPERVFPPFHISHFRRSRPVLKVQDGCTQGCAYCIVPLTRGPSRSRNPHEALAELRRLLDAGFREVVLSGINLRQYFYRNDNERVDFWDLLHFLDASLAPEWAGRARLRLSSVDPAQLDARSLDMLAEAKLLCPHLHVSLQSGSATVLQRMGRGHYTPETVLTAMEGVGRIWPLMALGADVITGFPGETEAEAADSLALIRALPLTYAHVFPYSERPGTRAATLPHPVPGNVRRARAASVRGVVAAKRHAFLDSLVGRACLVAMEPEGHGVNEFYIPCRPHNPPAATRRELLPGTITGVEKAGLVFVPS